MSEVKMLMESLEKYVSEGRIQCYGVHSREFGSIARA